MGSVRGSSISVGALEISSTGSKIGISIYGMGDILFNSEFSFSVSMVIVDGVLCVTFLVVPGRLDFGVSRESCSLIALVLGGGSLLALAWCPSEPICWSVFTSGFSPTSLVAEKLVVSLGTPL